MKEDYLEIIRNVGFQDVKVVAETSFPIESLLSETAGSDIIAKPQISAEQLNEIASSVLSIKVSALKPK
jgi:hypothetical protein